MNVSGLDSNLTLLYSFDAVKKVLSTYNFMEHPICLDERLRDSIIRKRALMVGDDRVNFLYNLHMDDSVRQELNILGVYDGYTQVTHVNLGKDMQVRLEKEVLDKGERIKYRHYFNDKKILYASLNDNGKGWGVTYNYPYGKFDLLIFTNRRNSDTDRQLSIVYTILPALLLLSVFLVIGRRMAKAKQYVEFYVFLTILVLLSPFLLYAMKDSAIGIALWVTLGLIITSAVLSFYNVFYRSGTGLKIWSVIYVVIISLALWLLWLIVTTPFKIGG